MQRLLDLPVKFPCKKDTQWEKRISPYLRRRGDVDEWFLSRYLFPDRSHPADKCWIVHTADHDILIWKRFVLDKTIWFVSQSEGKRATLSYEPPKKVSFEPLTIDGKVYPTLFETENCNWTEVGEWSEHTVDSDHWMRISCPKGVFVFENGLPEGQSVKRHGVTFLRSGEKLWVDSHVMDIGKSIGSDGEYKFAWTGPHSTEDRVRGACDTMGADDIELPVVEFDWSYLLFPIVVLMCIIGIAQSWRWRQLGRSDSAHT